MKEGSRKPIVLAVTIVDTVYQNGGTEINVTRLATLKTFPLHTVLVCLKYEVVLKVC